MQVVRDISINIGPDSTIVDTVMCTKMSTLTYKNITQ
jgi:hypothetical protein